MAQKPRANILIALPVREGFVDATEGQTGPARDLDTELKYMSEFTRVTREADADLVLTIVGRGIGAQDYNDSVNSTTFASQAVAAGPVHQNDYWVLAVLAVGPTYRKLLVGAVQGGGRSSEAVWSECSSLIAKDLRAFVRANASKFLNRRP